MTEKNSDPQSYSKCSYINLKRSSLHWTKARHAIVWITGYAKTWNMWNAYRGFKSQKEFSKAWSNGRTWMHTAEGQTILVQIDKRPGVINFQIIQGPL